MDASDETIIELSKRKIMLFLLGAMIFVLAGIWMLSLEDASIQSRRGFNDPAFVHGLGLVSIVFFGTIGLYALKKLFDKKPALIFNHHGIVDNASSASAGFIPWSDVVGAEICEIQKQQMLVIKVRDPGEYVARGSSLRRTLNKANYQMVGSPISISSNTLAISFSELVALFEGYRRKYGLGAGCGDLHHPLSGQDVHSSEALIGRAGHDSAPIKWDVEHKAQLLNWWPGAVIGTVGSGGIGILVLFASSLDMLFHLKIPFWAAAAVAMLPMLIYVLAVPDSLPHKVVRPAQWFAAVWYLVFSALSVSLAAWRGLETADVILVAFIMLGAWPCLSAVSKLRVRHKT